MSAHEPPDPDDGDELELEPPVVRTARRGKGLAVPGGVLVMLALFLPTLTVCDDPVYPIQFPPVYGPYLLGLAAAIGVLQHRRLAARGAAIFVVLMSVASLGLYGAMVWSMVFEDHEPMAVVMAIGWSFGVAAIVRTWRRRVSWHLRGARALWVTALGSLAFFGLLAGSEDALFGAWVALLGDVLVLMGGVCWEVEARHKRDAPTMPPMRVL